MEQLLDLTNRDPAKEFCLDRFCNWQLLGAHCYHDNKSPAVYGYPGGHPLLNMELEERKAKRGRICIDCKLFLIPTDTDHTFCNDCWERVTSGL